MQYTVEAISQINIELTRANRGYNRFFVPVENQRSYRIDPVDLLEGKPRAFLLRSGPRLMGSYAVFGFMWEKMIGEGRDTAMSGERKGDLYVALHVAKRVHCAVTATDEMIEGAAQHVGVRLSTIPETDNT